MANNISLFCSSLLICFWLVSAFSPPYQQQQQKQPGRYDWRPAPNPFNPTTRPPPPLTTLRPTRTPNPPRASRTYTVGILMYDEVEVLDFAGPFEVLALGGVLFNGFRVYLVAAKKHIRTQNGLNVVVDHVIGERGFPRLNVLVVPGSDVNGTIAAYSNPVNMNFIKSVAPGLDYLISVCTGLNIICRAGLANGLDVTTHHQLFEMAEESCPRSRFFRDRRFTDNGRVLTSAGISAGIDVSLYFAKKLFGKESSDSIAFRMEYDWKDFDYDPIRGTIPRNNI